MKIKLVRIGNSRGIRIPKAVIDQCGFNDGVELTVEDKRVVIAAKRKPRQGWAESFRKPRRKDELLLGDFGNQFDQKEWRW